MYLSLTWFKSKDEIHAVYFTNPTKLSICEKFHICNFTDLGEQDTGWSIRAELISPKAQKDFYHKIGSDALACLQLHISTATSLDSEKASSFQNAEAPRKGPSADPPSTSK